MEIHENLNQNLTSNYPNFVNPPINPPITQPITITNPNYLQNQQFISNPNQNFIPNVEENAPKEEVKRSSSNDERILMWYDLSLMTWFLVLCSGWNLFLRYVFIQGEKIYFPITTESPLALGAVLVMCTVGFIVYFRNTTLERNQEIWDGMLDNFSKFHSGALLFTTLVFMIVTGSYNSTSYIFGIIFGLIAYAGLIFVYLKTEFKAEWYIILVI